MEKREVEAWVREELQQAGKQPPLPTSDLAIIKAAAQREWRQLQESHEEKKSHWRDRRLLALAAALLLAVLAGWWWRGASGPAPLAVVARVEVVRGEGSDHEVGSELLAGATISSSLPTAIRMLAGESVRIAAGSSLQLVAATRLRLVRGRVYVDSGPSVRGDGVQIETPHGIVREIGTQFEVQIGDDAEPLRIRVREGEVLMTTNGDSRSAVAGEELALRDDGSVSRHQVAAFGEAWNWVLEVAPGFTVQDSSLADYLNWIEREIGCRIEFEDRELEQSVAGIALYGDSIQALTPRESLEVVLPGSGLTYEIESDILLVLRD